MTRDEIVDGEAMAAVEGNDVTHLLGSALVIDMQQEPQRRAFEAYRVAFRANQSVPNLANAAALVDAYRDLMDAMGVGQ